MLRIDEIEFEKSELEAQKRSQVKLLKKFKKESDEEQEFEDFKDIIQFKLTALNKEETTLKDKLDMLNKEKFDFLRELQ